MASAPNNTGRRCAFNKGLIGVLWVWCCAKAAAKTGVSANLNRTYKPTITNKALAKNGIRQPQALNSASLNNSVKAKKLTVASKNPMEGPSCGNMPNQPRLPAGALSVASKAAPPHSPPNPKPCPNLRMQSSTAAQVPNVV